MSYFSKRIAFAVKRELVSARTARRSQNASQEFTHLENAHILGQRSTYWHTMVHIRMLNWAIRNRIFGEFRGQLMRIVGAATKTAIGWVPTGNTGGSNVSPFAPMPLKQEHARAIREALKK